MPAPSGDYYVIGPEDILEITVWKQPELSGRVPVRPDGKISITLIGEVEAAGLTPPKLANLITEKLKTYVTKPQVNVMVQEVKSQFVNIVGEVLKPGRYETMGCALTWRSSGSFCSSCSKPATMPYSTESSRSPR
jgi:polysaccharide export outer membrane protein